MQTTTPIEQAGTIEKLFRLTAKHQQMLKWVVYILLIFNFGYYLFDDWRSAQTTLLTGASLLEAMSVYVTSIDEVGWFIILFLLEIETYWLDDDADSGFIFWLIQIVRIACYGLLGHTLYAYVNAVFDLGDASLITGIESVCELADQNLSFVRNLLYEPITASNCASLSTGSELYRFVGEPVVSDASGYQLAIQHAWIDVIDSSSWISLSLLITFVMYVQDRGIYDSVWIRGADRFQYFFYAVLTIEAIYWALYGFYVYTWDTLLWMGGFAAIDANLAEWRDELKDEDVSGAATS